MRVLEGGDEGEEGRCGLRERVDCIQTGPLTASRLGRLVTVFGAGTSGGFCRHARAHHTFHHLFVNSLIQQIFIDWFSVFGTLPDIVW